MNRIFRLKFKRQTRELVVVSEVTKGISKENSSTTTAAASPTLLDRSLHLMTAMLARGQLWLGTLFGLGAVITSTHAWAVSGHDVVNGHATFDVNGVTTTIRTTPNTIINWKDFNINKNEIVNFIQANEKSAVLNRVLGGRATEILGSLKSNGRVFIINPNGIIFGQGSQVNVGGLVASTLNIDNKDFINGKYNFTNQQKGKANPNALARVLNQGLISVNGNGNLMLIGGQVVNNGILKSQNGSIYLLAGKSITIGDLNNPSINYVISAGTRAINLNQIFSGGKVNLVASQVENQGEIAAVSKNGQVQLFATGSKGSVLNTGKIKANNINIQGSKIDIEAGSQLTAVAANDQAGHITIGSEELNRVNWKNPKLNGQVLADLSNTELTSTLTVADSATIEAQSTKAGKAHTYLAKDNKWDNLGVASINMYGKNAYYGGTFTAQNAGLIRTAAAGMAFGAKTSINTNQGLWLVEGQDTYINSYHHNTDVSSLGHSTAIDTSLLTKALQNGSVTVVSNSGNLNVQGANIDAQTTGNLVLAAKQGALTLNDSTLRLNTKADRAANGALTKVNDFEGNLYLFGQNGVNVDSSNLDSAVTTLWTENGFVLSDSKVTANQFLTKDASAQFTSGVSYYQLVNLSNALGFDVRSIAPLHAKLDPTISIKNTTFNIGSELSINSENAITLDNLTFNGVATTNSDKTVSSTVAGISGSKVTQSGKVTLNDTNLSVRVNDYSGQGAPFIFNDNAAISGNGANANYVIEVNRYAKPDSEGTDAATAIKADKLTSLNISNVNFNASATYYDQNAKAGIDFNNTQINLDHASASFGITTELSNSKINKAGEVLVPSLEFKGINLDHNSNLNLATTTDYYAYSAATGKNSPQLVQTAGVVNLNSLSVSNNSQATIATTGAINLGSTFAGGSLTLANHSTVNFAAPQVTIESAHVLGKGEGSSLHINSYNAKGKTNPINLALTNTSIDAQQYNSLTLAIGSKEATKETLGTVKFGNVKAQNLNLDLNNVKNINLGSDPAYGVNQITFVNVSASNSTGQFENLRAKNINLADASTFHGRIVVAQNLNVTNHSALTVGSSINLANELNVNQSSLSVGTELFAQTANIDSSTVDANDITVVNLNVSNISKVSAADQFSVTNLKLDGANSFLKANNLDASGNVTLVNGSNLDIAKIHAQNLTVTNNNLQFSDVTVDNNLNVTDSSLIVSGDITASSTAVNQKSKVEARSLKTTDLTVADSNLNIKDVTVDKTVNFKNATAKSFNLTGASLEAYDSDLNIGVAHTDRAYLNNTTYSGNELAVNQQLDTESTEKTRGTVLKVGTIQANTLNFNNTQVSSEKILGSNILLTDTDLTTNSLQSSIRFETTGSTVRAKTISANGVVLDKSQLTADSLTASSFQLNGLGLGSKANIDTLDVKGDVNLTYRADLTTNNTTAHNINSNGASRFVVNTALTANALNVEDGRVEATHAQLVNLSLTNASLDASDVSARSNIKLTDGSDLTAGRVKADTIDVDNSNVNVELAVDANLFNIVNHSKAEINQVDAQAYKVENSTVKSNLTFGKDVIIDNSTVVSNQNFVLKGNASLVASELYVNDGQAIVDQFYAKGSRFEVNEFDATGDVVLANTSVVATTGSLHSLSLNDNANVKVSEEAAVEAKVTLNKSSLNAKSLNASDVKVVNNSNLDLVNDLNATSLTTDHANVNVGSVNVATLELNNSSNLDTNNVLASDHINLDNSKLTSRANVITKKGIKAQASTISASGAISSEDFKLVNTNVQANDIQVAQQSNVLGNSEVTTKNFNTKYINLEESNLTVSNKLVVDSSLSVAHSNLKAQTLNVNGDLNVYSNAKVESEDIHAATLNASFGGLVNATKLNADEVIARNNSQLNLNKVNGVTKFTVASDSEVKTSDLNVNDLTVNHANLTTNDLTVNNLNVVDSANVKANNVIAKNQANVRSSNLSLVGNLATDNLVVTQSNVNTANLEAANRLTVTKSSLKADAVKAGDFSATNSKLDTNTVDATNSLVLDHSSVEANKVNATDLIIKGNTVNARNSITVGRNLDVSEGAQVNANSLNVDRNINVADASINANRNLSADAVVGANSSITTTNLKASSLTLTDNSDLSTTTAVVSGKVAIDNSNVKVANALSSVDLTVAGKGSNVAVGSAHLVGDLNVKDAAKVEVSDVEASDVYVNNASFKAHTVKANDVYLTDNSLTTVTKDLNVTDQVNVKSNATLSANNVNTNTLKLDNGVAQVNNLDTTRVIAQDDSSLLVTNQFTTGDLTVENSAVTSSAAQNHINDLDATDSQVTLTGSSYVNNVTLDNSQLYGVNGDLVVAKATKLDNRSDLEVGSLHTNDLDVNGNSIVRAHNIYVNNNLSLVTADVKANTLTTSNIEGTIYSDNSSIVTSDNAKLIARNINLKDTVFTSKDIYIQADTVNLAGNTRVLANTFNADTHEINLEKDHAINANAIYISCDVSNKIKCNPGEVLHNLKGGALSTALNNILHETTTFTPEKSSVVETSKSLADAKENNVATVNDATSSKPTNSLFSDRAKEASNVDASQNVKDVLASNNSVKDDNADADKEDSKKDQKTASKKSPDNNGKRNGSVDGNAILEASNVQRIRRNAATEVAKDTTTPISTVVEKQVAAIDKATPKQVSAAINNLQKTGVAAAALPYGHSDANFKAVNRVNIQGVFAKLHQQQKLAAQASLSSSAAVATASINSDVGGLVTPPTVDTADFIPADKVVSSGLTTKAAKVVAETAVPGFVTTQKATPAVNGNYNVKFGGSDLSCTPSAQQGISATCVKAPTVDASDDSISKGLFYSPSGSIFK